MEEQHLNEPIKARCRFCAWRGEVDEDGLMECHVFPPEIIRFGKFGITQQRPRMTPDDYCSYFAAEVDSEGNVL